MLIRATGEIFPGFYLLTLGESCHYLLSSEQSLVLFDPGSTTQYFYLKQRLHQLGVSLHEITHVLITHLHADRIGCLPYLKQEIPNCKVIAPRLIFKKLQEQQTAQKLYEEDLQIQKALGLIKDHTVLPVETYQALLLPDSLISDSELLAISSTSGVRAIASPGHTEESFSFLIEPQHFLITDEGVGYYQWKNLVAPGGDFSLVLAAATVEKLLHLELEALCLPQRGVLVGSLVRKHLQELIRNSKDLFEESKKAHASGVLEEEIKLGILNSFFGVDSSSSTSSEQTTSTDLTSTDYMVNYNLTRSFETIWKQVQATFTTSL